MGKYGLSTRTYDRILKLSGTIIDLYGAEQMTFKHVLEAITYRNLDRSGWAD